MDIDDVFPVIHFGAAFVLAIFTTPEHLAIGTLAWAFFIFLILLAVSPLIIAVGEIVDMVDAFISKRRLRQMDRHHAAERRRR